MRIVVASTYVPFIRGGGTMIVESLRDALESAGHTVDTVLVPLWSYWRSIPAQTLALRSLDLTESSGDPVDRVICIRYPSYAIRHPNKVVWFIHHHRGAYDLWDTPYCDMPNDDEGREYRALMRNSDTLYLREAVKLYTNSRIVAERLRAFNALEADAVVYPPLPDASIFRHEPEENYFIFASRLTPIKRQTVAVEAMAYVRSPFKLLLVGAPDVPDHQRQILETIEKFGVSDKVSLTGWLDEQEKAKVTARAFGALYLPFQEDSYGYSTLEAFHSEKPVITFTDSGGTAEIMRHGINGLVIEPDPRHLADAMESLFSSPVRSRDMGRAGRETVGEMNISWDHVVRKMTA